MAERLRFEVVESFERLSALERPWRALWSRSPAATPFSAPEWLLPFCRHLAQGPPWSVAVWEGRDLVALAPTFLYVEGGARVLGLLGGGVSDYQDVLATDAVAAEAVLRFLRAAGAALDRLDLRSLPGESPLLIAAGADGGATISRDDVCPVLQLPRRLDDLRGLASSKLLADIRRQRRHLAADREAGAVRAPPADPGVLLDDLFRLHGARWRARGEEGVLAGAALDRFHHQAIGALTASGLARLVAIRAGGRTIAALYALAARGRRYAYLQGIDPDAARLSPGTLVVAEAIEQAMAEGATELDLLRGNEPYKYRWGAVDRPTYRLVLRPGAAAHAPPSQAAPPP